MPINTNLQFEQASIVSDLGSLDSIRKQGLSDEVGAIKKAAKEFEAFFMNMMLKSMRQAGEVMGGDSMLSSNEEKMYVGMMDEQLSADLSQKGHLGIADMMLAQLNLSNDKSDSDKSGQIKSDKSIANPLNDYRLSPIASTKINANADAGMRVSLGTSAGTGASGETETKSIQQKIDTTNWLADLQLETKEHSVEKIGLEQISNRAPEKKSLFKEMGDFVSTLFPLAEAAAKKLQLDPKILLAQAALETGWGKFVMHDEQGKPGFNMFGIKASKQWSGDSISINTLEFDNQALKKVNANFRKYQNLNDSFNDYVDFLKQNPRYQKALDATDNASEFVNQLQNSGYASDPNYAKKIMRIFNDQTFNQAANQATHQLK